MLIDFLVHEVQPDQLECFPLFREYQQINSRNHTLSDFTRFDNSVHPEVDLLASLYSGFDGASLTQEQLQELKTKLSNFPASSLTHKLKDPSVNKLRKRLGFT